MDIQSSSSGYTVRYGHIDLGDGTYLFRTPGLTLDQTFDLYQQSGIGATTREQYFFESVSLFGEFDVVREITGTNEVGAPMSATIYRIDHPCPGNCEYDPFASIVLRVGDTVSFDFGSWTRYGDWTGREGFESVHGYETRSVYDVWAGRYRFYSDEPNSPTEHLIAEGALLTDSTYTVPEPATASLLGVALLAAYVIGRSSRRGRATPTGAP